MRILIAGSGAVGCYFGARLQLSGHQVCFMARGDRRDALERHGLSLRVGTNDYHLETTIAEVAQDWDFIFLCVKSWQVDETLAVLPLPADWRGTIVTTQNGVEVPDQVAALIGAERVLAGIVHGFFQMDGHAHVRHVGVAPRLIFNTIAAGCQETAYALHDAVETAGINSDLPDNIRAALWEKHLLSTALGGIGSFTHLPVGQTRSKLHLRNMIEGAMQEVAAISQAHGIALSADCVSRNMAFVDRFPADATTSMQRDIMAGRPSEFDAQTGAVIRFAEAAGLDVPINRFIYDALYLQERRARQG